MPGAMKTFASTVAACMDFPLPECYYPGVQWVSNILKERMGGAADRVVLYHADAVGLYIWQKYTSLFAPVYQHTSLALPMLSTVESVTPVAHATMYTGMDPEGHGIQTYVRPQLECDTLYDVLIREGKKVAIVAQADILIVVGTSLAVYPAASLTGYVRDSKVPIYLIDPAEPKLAFVRNPITHIKERSAVGMPKLVEILKKEYLER